MAPRNRVRRKRSKEICAQITALIGDYIAGALEPDSRHAFEQHLAICPDCVAFLNTYRTTVEAMRSLRFEDIPNEMVDRTEEFLRSEERRVGKECRL